MIGRFNEPRLMGNCERCYYATDKSLKHKRLEKSELFDCHRTPHSITKKRGDYCGEFAWNNDASLTKGASK